ncbi:UDP-N-acetylmuramyl peptide synthase [Corynebacterium sp. HMSC076G08]|uniref:Mur ligase family protein n=1 Tax=Corynebacterium TaxID=1716 RepID=UPI0006671575|nr:MULTISPECIES: MurT ligase domain-containing protein [Corynebacterium]OFK64305.1 UDP-N-acetylmuramyl peptide synthase [Corynebacterium sp. HMSC076G08]OFQ53168.1 UDP-N-acetylmuramyl peptide synthase [Corynebacterium sp. HMSC074H12]
MNFNFRSAFSSARTAVATTAATLATTASRATGRGAGGMIGGLIANAIDPTIMQNLAKQRPAILVTGTNGKSTTTRMLAAAVRTEHSVATNDGGDNMDAGIISALLAGKDASHLVLEVDELHVPHVADNLNPTALVLLNLSRDQLDRVGEINKIERALRGAVEAHPDMLIIANCDDVLMTSVAYDAKNVIWVSAGAGWMGESVTCPRTGGHIVREGEDWHAVKPLADGREFRRPTPTWAVTEEGLASPGGVDKLQLALPGQANRGNAAQAVAAAVEAFGVDRHKAIAAAESVDDVAGRYSTITLGNRTIRLLLAKNPAGWQEALSMVDREADGLVIATNGHVADGIDMSWLWDVRFEDFDDLPVKAAGERGTDLAVRLVYADISHELIPDPLTAIQSCPEGRIEVLANYTAFRDLKKALTAAAAKEHSND